MFRSVASNRNDGGAPTDATLFELEKNLADLLRESTVNVLKSNLPFFHQLDDAVLHTLCEKESGNFYNRFSERLECMLKCDEYAGAPEILGLVMGQIVQYIFIMNQMESLYVE